MVGIEWRKDEAENRARRAAIVALVEKRLDAQLADALKREAAHGKPMPAGARAGGVQIKDNRGADAKTP